MDAGVSQFGGNEALFLDILGYYVEDMHTLIDSMQTVDEGDLSSLAMTAHSIKGSSRGVFANRLGDSAEKIEHAAKDGDLAYVSSHHAAFVEEARQLVQDIEALRTEKGL